MVDDETWEPHKREGELVRALQITLDALQLDVGVWACGDCQNRWIGPEATKRCPRCDSLLHSMDESLRAEFERLDVLLVRPIPVALRRVDDA